MTDSPAHLPPPPGDLLTDAALFLDFDGTLVELAERPEAVVVGDALGGLLDRLAGRFEGRIALVSGRSIAQLDAFLGAAGTAIGVVGSHGAETRLAGGAIVRPERPASLDRAAQLFAERFNKRQGVVIEAKSLGVGLHYRLDPAVEDEAHALAEAFAAANDLHVQHGKMMVELRLPGQDKGSAIGALMERAPFAGHSPVFLGDDVTDEPGFLACVEHGGAGILVGEMRATAARYRLADVTAVHDWLAGAIA
ncbi:MAG: trehalose-phosphatase [Sphingomonas sp.]